LQVSLDLSPLDDHVMKPLRSRRVKCDETNPYCQRCLKLKLACGGYPDWKLWRSRKSQTARILPKGNPPAVGQLQTVLRVHQKSQIHVISSESQPLNEQEGQYFRIYLESIAKQIHAPFKSSLWERLIPQISEREPFIRQAIVAIGAISKAGVAVDRAVQNADHQFVEYQYALKQYGKALKGMRDAINGGKHDLRKAMIACLLVFTFEGMLGNQASAAGHAESGLMLLYRYMNGENSTQIPWQIRKDWCEHLFEEELLHTFTVLDLQVLLFMDHRSQEVHRKMKDEQNMIISRAPEELKSLDMITRVWQHMMSRNYHFCKELQGLNLKKLEEARADTRWEESANMKADELLLSSATETTIPLQKEKLKYLNEINRWSMASRKVFEAVAAGTSEHEKLLAAVLQVQAKGGYIMLAGAFFTAETSYDVFLPEFTTIVNLSAFLLAQGKDLQDCRAVKPPRFNFHVGIVPYLFLVGSRCRLDAVRQKAIDLLLSSNYREGIWDAHAVAHMAKWLRSIELGGMQPDGSIPEEHRAILTAVNIDLHRKRAKLACSQRTKDGPKTTETLLTW
jgi:hypothetical protein